jgi:hypothetical protein
MPARRGPTTVVAAALVTIYCGYETFAGRILELADGTVLAPGTVAGLLDEALIERIVFDGPSRVIDVGEARLFTGALRRAIEVRDRHCTAPGCHAPAQQCEVDHIVPLAGVAVPSRATAGLPASPTTAYGTGEKPRTTPLRRGSPRGNR